MNWSLQILLPGDERWTVARVVEKEELDSVLAFVKGWNRWLHLRNRIKVRATKCDADGYRRTSPKRRRAAAHGV